MHNFRSLTGALLGLLFLGQLTAQPNDNSPYSRFGLGDIHPDQFISGQTGLLGATQIDPWHINMVNPASYGHLQATAFEVGLGGSYTRLTGGTEKANVYQGNLEYFALGLPLINRINDAMERTQRDYDLGLVLALKPHSIVGYDVSSTEPHPDEGEIQRKYVGEGGSYKFMVGLGSRYKDFSVGINAGYLFGKISYNSLVYFADIPFAYNNQFSESFSMSGFLYNAGLQYSLVLNRQKMKADEQLMPRKLVFGLYGNTQTSFRTTGDVFYGGVLTGLDLGTASTDTLYIQEQLKGTGTLPTRIGGGIAYHHGYKWTVGMNYEQTLWSQYKNEGKLTEDLLSDAFCISAGADYVPDWQSYTDSYKRLHYRVGAYYRTDGRTENGQIFSEAAVNLGLGVPFVFKRKTSHIDLNLSVGQSMDERLISESFVKFGLGLTFNDQEWFIKRKYY